MARALTAALATICFFFAIAVLLQPPDLSSSDFYSFWAGAQLTGAHLYEPLRAGEIQQAVSPTTNSKRFIRPPFYAVALWPLGQMRFRTAYLVWTALNIAALFGFVWLWRPEPEALVACAMFLPLVFSFGIGQDAPLMLLAMAGGGRLIERKRDIGGGAVLALCAAKVNLFLFLPVALVAQRKYRALAGMALGGAVLYLISSAVMGIGWPAPFLKAVLGNEASIRPRLVGAAGLIGGLAGPWVMLALLILAGGVAVYMGARSAATLPALAFALAAGVVFAPRSLVYDGALFLPLLLPRFSPIIIAATGVMLMTTITPLDMVAQTGSIVVLWLARPRTTATGV